MVDPMHNYIANFPDNMLESIEIAMKHPFEVEASNIHNVVVAGLGGSGIGARVVGDIFRDKLCVPFEVVNDYTLPAYVSKNSLVICCSYSGNTEETLAVFEEAGNRGAQRVVISSGGMITEKAKAEEVPLMQIPGGQPPRTSFGYNSVQQFFALHYCGLLNDEFIDPLRTAAQLLKEEQKDIMKRAEEIAHKIKGLQPVIYAPASYEGAAIRLRQQFNENAKMLTWHHVFPEMNHNELVGWAGASDNLAVLVFWAEDVSERIQERIRLSLDIIREHTPHIIDMPARGLERIAHTYSLIHLGDWISYYTALHRRVDPVEIDVIDRLKEELAKK